MDTVRTFVAIELDAVLRAALSDLEAELRRAPLARLGRWVDPLGIHLTLKFLGNVPANQLPSLRQALHRAARTVAPFQLALVGLGSFSPSRPRVIWVGVHEPSGALERLQCAVEREMGAIGFPPEGRPFSPHLTLARIHDQANGRERAELAAWIRAQDVGELGTMRVTEIALMRSDLRPSGALYTRLEAAQLLQHAEG
jgi:2'-5' RNA ligase